MGDREMLYRLLEQLESKRNELHQAEARLREAKRRLTKASEGVREGEREVSIRIEIKSVGEDIDFLIDL